jgi:predicted glutamine amidotransferase
MLNKIQKSTVLCRQLVGSAGERVISTLVSRSPSPVATEEYTEDEKWDDYAEGEATVISRNPRPVDTE